MQFPAQSPAERLQFVLDRIQVVCDRSQRHFSDVSLVGVTKGHPFDQIKPFLDLDLHNIGENYLQEAENKVIAISDYKPTVRKHFIGHLQSNKAKKVLELFDTIHSVDSLKLAQELNKRCSQLQISDSKKFSSYPVFVEVNLSGDVTKTGCKLENVFNLVQYLTDQTEHLKPVGLMTISPLEMVEDTDLHVFFQNMHNLLEKIHSSFPSCKDLSMGMSDDFEIAIEEGSTIVRIGTLLFGPRTSHF